MQEGLETGTEGRASGTGADAYTEISFMLRSQRLPSSLETGVPACSFSFRKVYWEEQEVGWGVEPGPHLSDDLSPEMGPVLAAAP